MNAINSMRNDARREEKGTNVNWIFNQKVSFNFYNHPTDHLVGKYIYPYLADNKAES